MSAVGSGASLSHSQKEWLSHDTRTWNSQVPPGSHPGLDMRPALDRSDTGYVHSGLQRQPSAIADRSRRPAFLETDHDIATLKLGESMVPSYENPEHLKAWLLSHNAKVEYDTWDEPEKRRVSLTGTGNRSGIQFTIIRENTVRFEPIPRGGGPPPKGFAERMIRETFTTSATPIRTEHLPRRSRRRARSSGSRGSGSTRVRRGEERPLPAPGWSALNVAPGDTAGRRTEYCRQENVGGRAFSPRRHLHTIDKGVMIGLNGDSEEQDWDVDVSGSVSLPVVPPKRYRAR